MPEYIPVDGVETNQIFFSDFPSFPHEFLGNALTECVCVLKVIKMYACG